MKSHLIKCTQWEKMLSALLDVVHGVYCAGRTIAKLEAQSLKLIQVSFSLEYTLMTAATGKKSFNFLICSCIHRAVCLCFKEGSSRLS